jgi:hypothetical protein
MEFLFASKEFGIAGLASIDTDRLYIGVLAGESPLRTCMT